MTSAMYIWTRHDMDIPLWKYLGWIYFCGDKKKIKAWRQSVKENRRKGTPLGRTMKIAWMETCEGWDWLEHYEPLPRLSAIEERLLEASAYATRKRESRNLRGDEPPRKAHP